MTQIKICGITNCGDALAAAAAGADAVGFIFHRMSPRFIMPEKAREITALLPKGVAKVGVFVNAAAGEVERIAALCGLDLIQFHGDESPEYCRHFPADLLIKAVFLQSSEDIFTLDRYAVRAFLVDVRRGGSYGGTGLTADRGLAAFAATRHPLVLAGGLNEENIAAALAEVSPEAVDVNSGVEVLPGIKDREKIRRIVSIVKRGAVQAPGGIFSG